MRSDIQLFDVLRRHDVPFIIIGGHAVYFHGHERLTEDVDIIWFRSAQTEAALLTALSEIDACYIGAEIDPKTGIERTYPITLPFIRSTHLMMLWTKHGFLDLFDYIPSLPNEDVEHLFASCKEADGLRYVSLEWLRKMKQAAGRTKDLLDLEELEKLHSETD